MVRTAGLPGELRVELLKPVHGASGTGRVLSFQNLAGEISNVMYSQKMFVMPECFYRASMISIRYNLDSRSESLRE
jgi:hypothetical protein